MSADDWPDYRAAVAGQFSAARPDASAWVSANAGSGKTKVLIDRVARLLLRGVEPDEILCVTYTKAAASEMQARLFQRLGGWCVAEPDALRIELARLTDRPVEALDPADTGRARELFARALETPGGLRIETIHAFCSRVLRRFPLEAGCPPGFQELDETASNEIWEQAFDRLGRSLSAGAGPVAAAARTLAEEGGADGLNRIRRLAAKRAAITRYIETHGGVDDAVEHLRIWLGAPEEDEDSIMARTMGAAFPAERVRALTGVLRASKGASDQTLAAAIDGAVANAPADERYETWLSVFQTGQGDWRKANPFTQAAATAAPDLPLLFEMKSAPEGQEVKRIREAETLLCARRIFRRSAALLRLSEIAFADYARGKRLRAGLDFDDLIETTNSLLTERDASEWVLWKLDGGLSHILLDEAQDTSPLQWRLIEALTGDFFAGAGSARRQGRTLFAVGDEKQSIYSFQGAAPELFRSRGRDFSQRAEAASLAFEQPDLAMSFRSSPEVLAFVDTVFDTAAFGDGVVFSQLPPEQADAVRHTAFRRSQPGRVEVWPLEPRPEKLEGSPWDAPIGQSSAPGSAVLLGRRIARWIRSQIDAGASVWDRGALRPMRPGDVLILVRKRTGDLFEGLLQALKGENLPVAGADRITLLESLPVQDLLNLVRFALCPEDDLCLAEILTGPFGGLNEDDDLFPLAHGRRDSLFARLRASDAPRCQPVLRFLEGVLARRHLPAFELLTWAMERADGLAAPGWTLVLSRMGGPARDPVSALLDLAARDEGQSLQMFLDRMESGDGELTRELSGPSGEVRVMTVHGAKGLEAPVVILPDTVSGPGGGRGDDTFHSPDGAPIWAGSKSKDVPQTAALRAESDNRTLLEHRRLLYVGLTRACDWLVVCGAWAGNSKEGRDKASWHKLCDDAMSRLAERGQSRTAEIDIGTVAILGEPPTPLAPDAAAAVAPAPLPGWIDRPPPEEASAMRILAPSALSGDEPPVLSPFGEGRAMRLRRGRIIHTLLESLPELPPADRRPAALRHVGRLPGLTGEQAREFAEAALGVLEDPRFAPLFAEGGRAEAPIAGRLSAHVIVNGRIDRLVVTPTEVLAADFKTNQPAPDDIRDVAPAYIAQLAAYRALLAQAWPDRPVRCFLVWTDGPRLMEAPADLLDAALKSM